MNIPIQVAIHEAGHLTVGLHLGLQEQGIVFRPIKPGESAQAVFTPGDPKTSLVRCFTGPLAVLSLLPDTFEPHLLRAYKHSLILTPDHAHYSELTIDERNHLSGARTDMELAWMYASQIQPNNSESVKQRMREAEQEARMLVLDCGILISIVAKDIVAWGTEPDTDHGPMAIYTLERAKEIVCRREQNLNTHQQQNTFSQLGGITVTKQ